MARIGIDARFYGLGKAGLARYTQELIQAVTGAKSDHRFVAFVRDEDRDQFMLEQPNLEIRTTAIPHYTVREQLLFSRELAAANLDLMHFTNFNFPMAYRGRFVVTLHDLTLLSHAGRSKSARLKVGPMRMVVQQAARRSRKVLTISEYQKSLITETFSIPDDKVVVTYEAVDKQFRPLPPAKVKAFRKQHRVAEPFVMYAGQWREHKNLVRLIKAFKQVRAKKPVKLVLAGKIDTAFPIIPHTIQEQGLIHDVILTDFVPDEDLPYYYNAAELFVFPSLAEGFGLPPLEAMASGTPVAASLAPPLPETLGEAAVFFDPYHVDEIAAAILKLLGSSATRRKYRQRGLARVKRYSWQKTAKQTLEVYDQALADLY